jgi:hypothetical protein
MPHWDEDSAQLRANLQRAQAQATAQAIARTAITVEMIQAWHATTMAGLDIPEQEIPADEHGNRPQAQDFFGQWRGSAKLHHINVAVRDGERQLWGEHPAAAGQHAARALRLAAGVPPAASAGTALRKRRHGGHGRR